MDKIPEEILVEIFKYLDFASRLNASLVCHEWYEVLTSRCARMDDVSALNIFECGVWDMRIDTSAKGRLQAVLTGTLDQLASIPRHMIECNSLKIWFYNPRFLSTVLWVMAEHNMEMQCLNLYPYGKYIPLCIVEELFPDLKALVIRPHGAEFFWSGVEVECFPEFRCLDALILESVILNDSIVLPASLTELEWLHHDSSAFATLCDKIAQCPNLKHLVIGYVTLDQSSFCRLFSLLEQLKMLSGVTFKFVKFPAVSFEVTSTDVPLRVMKFDICYGDICAVVTQFRNFAPRHLQLVAINTIFEENQLPTIYRLVTSLAKWNIRLHLAIMQRSSSNHSTRPSVENYTNRPCPSPPSEINNIICRLDGSFICEAALLSSLVTSFIGDCLTDVKFVQCEVLSDQALKQLAVSAAHLRSLYIRSCRDITFKGIKHFLRHWENRLSKQLLIIWKTDDPLSNFYDRVSKSKKLCRQSGQLQMRLLTKHWLHGGDRDRIVIWDKSEKMLTVQNYFTNELEWTMGFKILMNAVETPAYEDFEYELNDHSTV